MHKFSFVHVGGLTSSTAQIFATWQLELYTNSEVQPTSSLLSCFSQCLFRMRGSAAPKYQLKFSRCVKSRL